MGNGNVRQNNHDYHKEMFGAWSQNSIVQNDERVDIRKVKCVECVKLIRVRSSDMLEPGDHVVFKKENYDHHVIISSKLNNDSFEIIEVTNTSVWATSGISSSSSLPSAKSKANIERNTKTFNFKMEIIAVVKYEIRFEKAKTIQIANFFADENPFFNYHCFSNNCEHFATYCTTGHRFSCQVSKMKLQWKLRRYRKRRELELFQLLHKSQLICDDCFMMNKHFYDVDVIPIAVDVKKGDIIRFLYVGLIHYAVVLQNVGFTDDSILLKIAHFAFCGLHEHRTIKKEIRIFPLNGNCVKVNYTSSRYNLYPPDEVVKRAKRRINEQFYVAFSNDSSHFARWCKLKV